MQSVNNRVVFLANSSSIHTRRWVEYLTTQGFEITICSFSNVEIAGATLVYLERKWRLPGKLDYLLHLRTVRNTIKNVGPFLVHAHYASSYGLLGALANFRPLVISVWGSDVFLFPKTSPIHRAVLKYCFRRSDYLCSTSKIMATEIQKYSVKPITLTPFGIDTKIYCPVNVESKEPLIIGTIKRLEEVYGIDYLIQAFAILKSRTRHNIKLTIVGSGSQKAKLQTLCLDLGVAQFVEFIEEIPQDQVPAYLNKFSIYAALSRSESFGVAVLEASSCAVPVVTSNAGGLPEVVVNGQTGLLTAVGDVAAAAEALARLIDDQALCQGMGERGREFVKRNYEWQQNAAVMKNLYLTIQTEAP